jgi:hypothetical protein
MSSYVHDITNSGQLLWPMSLLPYLLPLPLLHLELSLLLLLILSL